MSQAREFSIGSISCTLAISITSASVPYWLVEDLTAFDGTHITEGLWEACIDSPDIKQCFTLSDKRSKFQYYKHGKG
jgi:hypothetical protein